MGSVRRVMDILGNCSTLDGDNHSNLVLLAVSSPLEQIVSL